MLEIVLRGETMALLPERAVWWAAQKAIILSDLHWGKGGHFRKNGIAIPLTAQIQDELRLARLIRQYNAERLFIAGDFFHSSHNQEVEQFRHWRQAHASLHIDLVEGNHDILHREWYAELGITLHEPALHTGPFLIAHDALPVPEDIFLIHGHVHPGVRLQGKARQALTLSCFCVDDHRMILPAFGHFTGRLRLEATQHRHLYAIAGPEVIQLK